MIPKVHSRLKILLQHAFYRLQNPSDVGAAVVGVEVEVERSQVARVSLGLDENDNTGRRVMEPPRVVRRLPQKPRGSCVTSSLAAVSATGCPPAPLSLSKARLSRSSSGRPSTALPSAMGAVWRTCWSRSDGLNGSSECSQMSGAGQD